MRWCALAVCSTLSLPALAQESQRPAEPPVATEIDADPNAAAAEEARGTPAEPETSRGFGHRHQIGLRATFGKGYRIAFAYDESDRCGADDDQTCYSSAPAFADLDLSFGLTEGVEASAAVRLGLEREYDDAFPVTLGLGFRFYSDALSRVKVFVGARILWDLTETGTPPKQDFAVRAEPGLIVEIVRHVGLYAQTGVTAGFLRWLRFEIDAGGGLQVRFP